jgi:hypothetical protein
MGKTQQYLTIKAAQYLRVVQNTLQNRGRGGKIKERRNPVNGSRLCDKADLNRLLRRAVNENIPVAKLAKSFGTLCDRPKVLATFATAAIGRSPKENRSVREQV